MKKLVCIATVIFCLAACFVPCYAAHTVIFTLKAEQQPEENVKLSVTISKDSSLYTSEFFINYDENTLDFIESKAKAGEITAELQPYFSATKVSDSKIKVSYTSSKPLDIGGTLCELEFRAKKDIYTGFIIEIDHAETFDGEHIRSLDVECVGTGVEVTEQFHLNAAVLIVIAAAICTAAITAVIYIKKKKSR